MKLSSIRNELFYSRNDPNDQRLGDIVMSDIYDYEKTEVVIVGCPQDIGVQRNKGRAGADKAPEEIRKALYKYPVTHEHSNLKIFDSGDIKTSGTLEEIHKCLFKVVRSIIADKKKLIILGGGNDISYPDCAALSMQYKNLLVFNIDRHLDVRSDKIRNSGTPYFQLLEEGYIKPELFYEFGINSFANSPVYIKYLEEKGAHIFYLAEIRKHGIKNLLQQIIENSNVDSIFCGFDMDVVRAVDAPGVSDSSPMGLTAMEVCEIADIAASDPRTKIIEITEVNPKHDIGGITSKLAANIIMRALAK